MLYRPGQNYLSRQLAFDSKHMASTGLVAAVEVVEAVAFGILLCRNQLG